ncbi:salicylate hydroxylase [Annulohypoxylon maeteangense]|uniref:salicylate hydroxylase n=1 Tax=Annulohypoxylon maeteangense TaxID=1927788 RepID=UPI002008BE6C|nr:salicylate hydroxylase [Annulohypoxylon maeteangense]KAI0881075.1 salicylate hydroxylase [Annulohypoxylon maeteangense]
MDPLIRIAIIGGGVAGASLIHALVKFSHLDVHIFESAAEFKEAGMAFGIARNAQAALQLIGPEAAQCLERAGAVPMRGVRIMLAQGEWAGSIADEIDEAAQGKRLTSIVHRANFLQELLAGIPQDQMHASKKLQKIDQNGPITLYFVDGTTHECDILIGADGIHSTVRKLVLGENDPAAYPQNSGAWCIMMLEPFDKAQAILGKELVDIENAREYGWVGPNAFLMHNILSDGQIVQFVITSNDREVEPGSWQRKAGADEIKKIYQDFPPLLNKAVIEILCNQPEHNAFYLWDHPKAHTYVSGPICVTGDAAHSTTPWQGSGGGMSIEDSMILSTLLGRAKSPVEALTALKVYDQVRRPRTQQVVESSRVTGTMLTGVNEETGLDIKKFKSFMSRWDFIIDIDMEKHRDEALQMMEAELRKSVV